MFASQGIRSAYGTIAGGDRDIALLYLLVMPSATIFARRIHMYLGLFLTPWVLMYALSSLAFNHFATVRSWYGGNVNQFERVEEIEYSDAFDEGVTPQEAARQILLDLDMDGPHFVRGNLRGDHLAVMRQKGVGVTRLSYYRGEGKVVVEEQVVNAANTFTRMHIRHGFEQSYWSAKLWGLGVEVTALSMLFWILSGVWLWWTIKPARVLGGLFALGGFALFSLLLFTL